MLSIVLIVLILVGITIHRYLSAFWEQGLLPYSMGFLLFAHFFALTYLVSFIWMFGVIPGIVVSLLCYFQIVYSAGLWVFGLPWLIRMNKPFTFTTPTINLLAYGGFSFLVIVIVALTALNFVVSKYRSMWELIGENHLTVVVFVGILIIGNVTRVVIMPKFVKQ